MKINSKSLVVGATATAGAVVLVGLAGSLIVEITLPKGVEPMGFLGRPEAFEGRKGAIEFSQMSGSQNRHVLLRCRVDPDTIKDLDHIADVELRYRNELAGDSPEIVRSSEVKIGYTENAEVALNSRDEEVEVEWNLVENAIETDKAIALADAGKNKEACSAVDSQIAVLCDLKEKAPAAQQESIQKEIDLWEANRKEFTNAGLSKEGRKVLQWNSYQTRTSKMSTGSTAK